MKRTKGKPKKLKPALDAHYERSKQKKLDKKARLNSILKERYSSRRQFDFKSVDMVSTEKFYYIDNAFALYKFSKRAMCVYPVICTFADFDEPKWFHMSIRNIGKFAGMGNEATEAGLWELQQKGKLLRKKVQKGSESRWEYKLEMDVVEGKQFIFYTSIVECGIWAKMSQRAKAAYLVLRSIAKFDIYTYAAVEDENVSPKGIQEDLIEAGKFRYRKFDVADVYMTWLSEVIHVNYRDMKKVFNELEKYGLAEYGTDGYHLVTVYPTLDQLDLEESIE